jgi:predicted DCC family thiol-disulfide oxidoreductase YuxK
MSEGSVIVFDGVCVLCSGWVRFLLRHDRRQRYRFAAMQSTAGRELLRANGLNADDPASFLLLEAGRAYFNSDAIIRVLRGLGGAWRAAVLLRLVPAFIRDAIYVRVARNRYRWFGQRDVCMRPEPQHSGRFIS